MKHLFAAVAFLLFGCGQEPAKNIPQPQPDSTVEVRMTINYGNSDAIAMVCGEPDMAVKTIRGCAFSDGLVDGAYRGTIWLLNDHQSAVSLAERMTGHEVRHILGHTHASDLEQALQHGF
jgi:hypothetical protein